MSIDSGKIAEIILNTTIFGGLSEDIRIKVASKMREVFFDAKENIVVSGEHGDTFYLIESGLVEVIGKDIITDEEFVLAHLGPGDCFGEMSLLTGELRSATVRTFEPTKVFSLDNESFNELMLNSSQMGLSISKILAGRLGKLNQKMQELRGQQIAINKMFNTEQDMYSEIAVIGRSNSVKYLSGMIDEISKSDGIWAIIGEKGTGKRSISRLIHRKGARKNQPFLILDCKSLDKEQQKEKIFGSNKDPGCLSLLQSGTLVVLNASLLDDQLLQDIINKLVISVNSQPLVLCSYQAVPENLLFNEKRILNVPSLVSRKQDIPLIAKKILERLDKSNNTRPIKLSSNALKRLLEHNWPGNLAELESVLEQSLVLSKSSVISDSNIIFDLPAAMQDPYLESVKSLAIALDAKDPYTAGHSERVARYSQQIAKQMNLPDDCVENLYTMALFHDVGKIGVPESILRKQAHLTQDEYIQIQKHPESSLRILQPLTKYQEDVKAVFYHHTNYDGTGYPGGLSGESIPIGARIISVADTFDAMTTDRPYRKSLSIDMAKRELRRVAGKQLDPDVINVMISIIDSGTFTEV